MSNFIGQTLEDYRDVLNEIEPFNFINEDVLEKTLHKLKFEEYPEGSYIIKQGDISKGVIFIVIKGKVELLISGDDGEDIRQGEILPYNFFGTPTFFTDGYYSISAKATEEVECLVLDKITFYDLAKENPKFSRYFKKSMGERLMDLYSNYVMGERHEFVGGNFRDEASLWVSIKENMKQPVVTCNIKDDAIKVARLMESYDISSVVVLDEDSKVYGIITEQDLAHKVVAKELSLNETFAEDICTRELVTLRPDEYMYKGLMFLINYKIKHLLVVDEVRKPVGILTLKDFVKSKEAGAINIAISVENAKEISDLLEPSQEVRDLLIELIKERVSAEVICEVMTEYYDLLTRKVIEISEKEMVEEGYGRPPVNYSFITMGSSGRKEQLIGTDLDNGIIFEDPYKKDEKEVKNYFLILGEKIIDGLVQFGFKRCRGGLMASNPQWCRSFRGWRELIRNWAESPDEKNIRPMSIFLDFRHIYGDKRYYQLLKNYVLRTFRESTIAQQFLVMNILINKPPIGMFGQIRARKDEDGAWVDLKKSACVHVVESMKVFSLREGISETNTFERLNQLHEKNVFSKDEAKYINASYEVFMRFKLKENVEKIKKGKVPDNRVVLNKLTRWEKNILKESLSAVDNLQNLASQSFHAYL